MADLTDDQLDDLERIARAGSPGPFQAAFSYRDPGNVLALLADVRRARYLLARAEVRLRNNKTSWSQADEIRAFLNGAEEG
jgi:hypothetical protein